MNQWMDELQEICPVLEAPAGHTGLDFSHSCFCKKWIWQPWLRPQKSLIRHKAMICSEPFPRDAESQTENPLSQGEAYPGSSVLLTPELDAESRVRQLFGKASWVESKSWLGQQETQVQTTAPPMTRENSTGKRERSVSCVLILKTEPSVVVVSCSVMPFATFWTVAHQAPLSMGFSRHEYWSG